MASLIQVYVFTGSAGNKQKNEKNLHLNYILSFIKDYELGCLHDTTIVETVEKSIYEHLDKKDNQKLKQLL